MSTGNVTPLPSWGKEARGLSWLAREAWDHLWPWQREGLRQQKALQLGSLLMAVVATLVWGLAASGQVRGNLVIAWWLAWSVMEVAVRVKAKPYVKEGPWWGRHYRRANLMDMVCYVTFKNLLVGAVLFIGLKSLGVLSV